MTLAEDRRRKRSNDPLVALHYQLSQARSEGSMEAIVVADGSGLVVAGVGAWAACEELAAFAPFLTPSGWLEPAVPVSSVSSVSLRVAEMRAEVDVQSVDVGGQTVLLCARGGKPPAATLEKIARGVARILKG